MTDGLPCLSQYTNDKMADFSKRIYFNAIALLLGGVRFLALILSML